MFEDRFERVRRDVLVESPLHGSFDHGERHWRAVALAGLRLAPAVPECRPRVVLWFALFHDAMRENEYDDPEHGLRGGELARRLNREHRFVDPDNEELLYLACRDHNGAPPSEDPTLGVCWDADRVNLWRVGKTPRPEFISTSAALGLVEEARGFHRNAPEWADLVQLYEQVAARI